MKKALLLAAAAAFAAASVQAKDAEDILGFPSAIPHPIESYMPITPDRNMCTACHKQQAGEKLGKMEIPNSHFTAQGALDGSRHECTLCHAPVATLEDPAAVDPNSGI